VVQPDPRSASTTMPTNRNRQQFASQYSDPILSSPMTFTSDADADFSFDDFSADLTEPLLSTTSTALPSSSVSTSTSNLPSSASDISADAADSPNSPIDCPTSANSSGPERHVHFAEQSQVIDFDPRSDFESNGSHRPPPSSDSSPSSDVPQFSSRVFKSQPFHRNRYHSAARRRLQRRSASLNRSRRSPPVGSRVREFEQAFPLDLESSPPPPPRRQRCGAIQHHSRSDVFFNPSVFKDICILFGISPTFDVFASSRHHQLPRFFCKDREPGATAVNAFLQDWRKEDVLYINPPWELIPHVLAKIQHECVQALMIVPHWPSSSSWWPILQTMVIEGCQIHGPIYLSSTGQLLPPPRWTTCAFIIDGHLV